MQQRRLESIQRALSTLRRLVPIRHSSSLFCRISFRQVTLTAAVIAIGLSSFVAPLASAKAYGEMNPTEQMKSWLYYNALSFCIQNRPLKSIVGDRLSESDASAGTFFYTNSNDTNPDIAYFLKGAGVTIATDKGAGVQCDDAGGWVLDAVQLWGYSGGIDLLCDMGARRVNGSDCRDGSDSFTGTSSLPGQITNKLNLSTFQNNIKDRVYGGSEPSRSNAARYIHARNAFFVACLGSSSPSPYTGSASDDFVYTVNVVNQDGGSLPTKYYGVKKSSDSISYSVSPGLNNQSATCGELAAQMNQYAPAYQEWVADNIDAGGTGDLGLAPVDPNAGGDEDSTTCAIDGLGWLLCPVINFVAGITDGAYVAVAALLTVDSSMFDRSDAAGEATYTAWGVMRSVANVAFVIAFLIIIYSQLTGFGVSNYGVKKMLPRLIIAAILVNLSFIVCALAVDISNLVGSTLKGVIDNITNGLNLAPGGVLDQAPSDGTLWTWIGTTILAGGVIAGMLSMGMTLAVFLPILIAALSAIVTVVVVLTLRQALIILLIVISPLAFVAFLLPNTEGLFKKWRSLFLVMLVMFPAVAGIFGVSALAGKIVMSSDNFLVQMMGAGITIIPLFITPVIMKSAGGVLNRFAGMVNNKDKGVFDRMRKGAQGYKDYRGNVNKAKQLGRVGGILGGEGKILGGKNSARRKMAAFVASGGASYGVNRDQKRNYAQAEANETAQEYFAKRVIDDEEFAKKIGGGKATSLQASAQAAVDKLEAESVNSREVLLRSRIDPRNIEQVSKALEDAIKNKDVAGARAAQRILLGSGMKGIQVLSETIGAHESEMDTDTSKALRKDINAAGLKSKNNALATWAFREGSLGARIKDTETYSGLNAAELAGQDIKILQQAPSGAISAAMAQSVLSNQQASQLLDDKKRTLFESIANGSLSVPRDSPPETATPAPTSSPATSAPATPPLTPEDQRDIGGLWK